jgi:hypothetical protein
VLITEETAYSIPILMSLPFAVAPYGHAAFLSTTSAVAERPDWKRILVLWAGMPLSLVVGSLTILGKTRFMYTVGFGTDNLPFDSVRLLIGEGAACFGVGYLSSGMVLPSGRSSLTKLPPCARCSSLRRCVLCLRCIRTYTTSLSQGSLHSLDICSRDYDIRADLGISEKQGAGSPVAGISGLGANVDQNEIARDDSCSLLHSTHSYAGI